MSRYAKGDRMPDGWRIEQLIGSGCFGNVYEIVKEQDGIIRRSALKVVPVPDEAAREKLCKWLDKVSVLNGHRNYVGIEEFWFVPREQDAGYDLLIRMKLAASLVEKISRQGLFSLEGDQLRPESTQFRTDVIKLGIDICNILELCHENHIIHGNIHPHNIFVDDIEAVAKLGDAGLLQVMADINGKSFASGVKFYSAPEIWRGAPCDRTTDLYSLGMVMYRLLNRNRMPFMPDQSGMFTVKEREEALKRIMEGEALPPPCNASEELSGIILKACAFRPEDRYRSASEMKKDLQQAMNNESKRNTYPYVYMEQEKMCQYCGARNSAENKYCVYCGMPLQPSSVDDVVPIPQGDPDDPSMRTIYASPNVMNDVYASPDRMAILYASPEPIEDYDPDAPLMKTLYASPRPSGGILSGLANLFKKK